VSGATYDPGEINALLGMPGVCTERQAEMLGAILEHKSANKASQALGCDKSNVTDAVRVVRKKAAQRGFAPASDLIRPLPEGLALQGSSVRYDRNGEVDQSWIKSKQEGRDPAEVVRIDNPAITKTSTQYGPDGRVTQQWVSERPKDAERFQRWEDAAKALAKDLPKIRIAAPKKTASDLMACYPIGDHHIGMYAWHSEAGADYDLEKAEALLSGAIDHLIDASPACDQALVVILGDFLHYDSLEPLTPASKNLLDSDGRASKMIEVGLRCARRVIEAAAAKHKNVRVIIEPGNHDPYSSLFFQHALAALYEKEKRIEVDVTPGLYHYYEFGRCLIGVHHGDKAKLDKLPLIMAQDQSQAWGRTDHRYWWTGHIHQQQVHDVQGIKVESFRVLPPTDAWAHGQGYRSQRSMVSILLHREHGEVSRHTVNPAMLEAA
jgi:hypothetical protein